MPDKRDTLCGTCGGRRPAGKPCPTCRPKVQQTSDRMRGTAAERGYSGKSWRVARRARLRSSPYCECAGDLPQPRRGPRIGCGRHHGRCFAQADTADHFPRTRRELVAAGVTNPDRVIYLRSLCSSCHSSMTADDERTRGGWHAQRQRTEDADDSTSRCP